MLKLIWKREIKVIRKVVAKDLKLVNELIKNLDPNEIVSKKLLDHPFYRYLVYELNSEIIAVLKYSIIYERIEIDYIYVLEKYRRKGVATKLINYIVEENKNCKNFSLEVRKSNIAAQKLYENLGFKVVNIRKNYYGNEDALIYMRSE